MVLFQLTLVKEFFHNVLCSHHCQIKLYEKCFVFTARKHDPATWWRGISWWIWSSGGASWVKEGQLVIQGGLRHRRLLLIVINSLQFPRAINYASTPPPPRHCLWLPLVSQSNTSHQIHSATSSPATTKCYQHQHTVVPVGHLSIYWDFEMVSVSNVWYVLQSSGCVMGNKRCIDLDSTVTSEC